MQLRSGVVPLGCCPAIALAEQTRSRKPRGFQDKVQMAVSFTEAHFLCQGTLEIGLNLPQSRIFGLLLNFRLPMARQVSRLYLSRIG
jgi:hypothetical protein